MFWSFYNVQVFDNCEPSSRDFIEKLNIWTFAQIKFVFLEHVCLLTHSA